ncbi:MAG: Holliday junction branch migration protein RuvA [Sphaerochaetaceae bacterium]|jgi:Holliday junction DNA helicase RuvA
MIHALIGEIISVEATEVVLRTQSSIEFILTVSHQTSSQLSQLTGERKRDVRILTWMHHRDDIMALYGFSDEQERLLFLELIKVSGIGPRQAMKILGGVQVKAFIEALDAQDLVFLSSIPGIGPKTSQKIVLALRDTAVLDFPTKRATVSGFDHTYRELIVALSDMGYDKPTISRELGIAIEENQSTIEKLNLHEAEEFLFKVLLKRLG